MFNHGHVMISPRENIIHRRCSWYIISVKFKAQLSHSEKWNRNITEPIIWTVRVNTKCSIPLHSFFGQIGRSKRRISIIDILGVLVTLRFGTRHQSGINASEDQPGRRRSVRYKRTSCKYVVSEGQAMRQFQVVAVQVYIFSYCYSTGMKSTDDKLF